MELRLSPAEQYLYNAQLIAVSYDKPQAGHACRCLRSCINMIEQGEMFIEEKKILDSVMAQPLDNVPIDLHKLGVMYAELMRGKVVLRWKKGLGYSTINPSVVDIRLGEVLDFVGLVSEQLGKAMDVKFDLLRKKRVDAI